MPVKNFLTTRSVGKQKQSSKNKKHHAGVCRKKLVDRVRNPYSRYTLDAYINF